MAAAPSEREPYKRKDASRLQCFRCRKVGHIASECRTNWDVIERESAAAASATTKVKATEKSTHYVDLFAVSRRAGHCNPRQFRALIVDVAVNRANERTAPRSTTALLDSGAQVSGVDAGAVAKLFAWTALEPLGDDDPLLRAAGGSELVCTGKLRDVRVRVGEAWLAVPLVYVIKDLRYPLLIGINDVVRGGGEFAVRSATFNRLEIRIGSSGWVQTARLPEPRPRYVARRAPRFLPCVTVVHESAAKAAVAPAIGETAAPAVAGAAPVVEATAPVAESRAPAMQVVEAAVEAAAPATKAPEAAVAVVEDDQLLADKDEWSAETSPAAAETLLAANDEKRRELGDAVREAVALAEEPVDGVMLPLATSAFGPEPRPARSATCAEEQAYCAEFRAEHAKAADLVEIGPVESARAARMRETAHAAQVFCGPLELEAAPPFINTEVTRKSDGMRVRPAPVVRAANAQRAAAASRAFRIRDRHRAKLFKIRDAWLKSGRIRLARTALALAQAFMVETVKEDGSIKLRMVQAHNESNERTIGSALPMPDPEAILEDLSSGKLFMAVDAASGFHALPLMEGSGQNCCITFGDGVAYEPSFLPMGVAVAPQHYGAQMSQVFTRTTPRWRVRVFIDDIAGSADDEEALEEMWAWVVEQAAFFNITLSAPKSKVGLTKISLLGVEVQHNRVEAKRSYLDSIAALSRPEVCHELRQLIGMTQWVLRHLPDAVTPVQVLAGAIPSGASKSTRIQWTEELVRAFDALRAALANPRALVPFDPTRPVVIVTDASAIGGGAVLGHPNTATGDVDVVDMLSHKFSDAETRYPVAERELLMLRIAALAGHWHHRLRGRTVYWATDSKPMAQLLRSARLSNRQRLRTTVLDLIGLRIVCVYVRGDVNQAADVLSRLAVENAEAAIDEDAPLEVAGQVTVGAIVAQWTRGAPEVQLLPLEAMLEGDEEESAGVGPCEQEVRADASLEPLVRAADAACCIDGWSRAGRAAGWWCVLRRAATRSFIAMCGS
jgi:hypothetical protein